MKLSSVLVLAGFLSLTVSCAHKSIELEKGPEPVVQTKKVEVKIKNKKQANNNKAYTCLVGKDKRQVTLDTSNKRCEVHYTKFGDRQQVAWAESTPSICEDAFSNIRSNIEGSGYKCNEGLKLKEDAKKKPLETAAN